MDFETVKRCLDDERRTLARAGEALEALPRLSRLLSADGSWHSVIFSSLSADSADAAIAQQVAHYRTQTGEVEWKLYGYDEPANLLQRLARHGFEIGPRESVLVLDLNDPPTWFDSQSTHPVVRVASLEQVDLFRQLAEEIFAKDHQFTANELSHGIRTGSTEHLGYIAMDDTVAASIGRLYTHEDSCFGGLFGGGTLSSHRGRGLYRALVAARARDAAELGARYLIVDALPTSQPILERLGFTYLTDTWPCALRRQTPSEDSSL